VIRYDGRGSGLSDRDVTRFSIDTDVLDLEAVADRLSLDSFVLQATGLVGCAAISYAARSPERVSRLILFGCSAQGARYVSRHLRALQESNWVLYTETITHYTFGLDTEETKAIAAFARECVTQSTYRALMDVYADYDVTSLLPAVQAPTLVLHPQQSPIDVAASSDLAAGIPDARLVVLDGNFGIAFDPEDRAGYRSTIDEFLGLETQPKVARPSGTAIILFADIVDSTALTERLGDSAFREKARALDATLRAIIREHSGTAIEGKLLGDGVLAIFTSARQAIEAALACGRAGADGGLPLHLGVHAGDVIREDDNVFGGAVNIASRISGLSAPGEVLISDTVRSLARTSSGVTFEDRGEHTLKGIAEPVRVFAVRQA
jgi:class 3 adenylate cyclase